MSAISIRELQKVFLGTPPASVLSALNLDVPESSVTAVIGASGCGKTTLLRLIAGLERPDAGTISIDNNLVAGPNTWVPPERRQVGLVPQQGALFPHLNVAANVGFGLDRQARKTNRVPELLELVGMSAYGKRMPWELSGGQQQRVALARALAPNPKVVLLDEPFAALDATLRQSIRKDVRSVLVELRTTVVLVTHDQEEALSMADQVALMRSGRIVQSGSPDDVYRTPADLESGTFLGDAILLDATFSDNKAQTIIGTLTVRNGSAGEAGQILIRPEQFRLHARDEGVVARVVAVQYFGHDALVSLVVENDNTVITNLTARHLGSGLPAVGELVGLTVDGDVVAFPSK